MPAPAAREPDTPTQTRTPSRQTRIRTPPTLDIPGEEDADNDCGLQIIHLGTDQKPLRTARAEAGPHRAARDDQAYRREHRSSMSSRGPSWRGDADTTRACDDPRYGASDEGYGNAHGGHGVGGSAREGANLACEALYGGYQGFASGDAGARHSSGHVPRHAAETDAASARGFPGTHAGHKEDVSLPNAWATPKGDKSLKDKYFSQEQDA
jgi:hypothetical protein